MCCVTWFAVVRYFILTFSTGGWRSVSLPWKNQEGESLHHVLIVWKCCRMCFLILDCLRKRSGAWCREWASKSQMMLWENSSIVFLMTRWSIIWVLYYSLSYRLKWSSHNFPLLGNNEFLLHVLSFLSFFHVQDTARMITFPQFCSIYRRLMFTEEVFNSWHHFCAVNTQCMLSTSWLNRDISPLVADFSQVFGWLFSFTKVNAFSVKTHSTIFQTPIMQIPADVF